MPFTVELKRTTVSGEEPKNRRNEEELRASFVRANRLPPLRQPDTDMASAAMRFARQDVQESRIQTAWDASPACIRDSWTSCRPAEPAAADTKPTASYLRFFGSSM
jgi:hypothetical protein